jgi:PBP1b-binding outer membrane lipoprotein LpoB
MKRLYAALFLIFVLSVLVTGCSSEKEVDDSTGDDQQATADTVDEGAVDGMINDEIVDEDEYVEIGEMI